MSDVKSNAEALVPKFKLDRILNQGRIPNTSHFTIPRSIS